MQLAGITYESVVDGPGIRLVIFVQGCPHHCFNCHNHSSWAIDGGDCFSVKQIRRILMRQRKVIQGITLSGGEPFLQPAELTELAIIAHHLGFDVVTYTGFTYEELCQSDNPDVSMLLENSDILIDGPYIDALRDISLSFRGSANQRVIDLVATRRCNNIVIFCE